MRGLSNSTNSGIEIDYQPFIMKSAVHEADGVVVYLHDQRVEMKSYECLSDLVNEKKLHERNEAWHSEAVKTCATAQGWEYKIRNHTFFVHLAQTVSGSNLSTALLICVNAHLCTSEKCKTAYLDQVSEFGEDLVCALNMHNATVFDPKHKLRNVFIVSPPPITNLGLFRVATALFRGMLARLSDMSPKFLLSSQFNSVVLVPRDRRQ